MPVERLVDELGERIQLRGAKHLCPVESVRLQNALDRLVMQIELAGDRPDFPVFDMEQTTDPGHQLGRDHGSPALMERIDGKPAPAANDAARPGLIGGKPADERFSCGIRSLPRLISVSFTRGWRNRSRRREVARSTQEAGSTIRHASGCLALPVVPLPITVVECSFVTLLVAAVGLATHLHLALPAAAFRAIALPTIATTTDPERSPAPLGVATSLSQNELTGLGHPVLNAGLDNEASAWQGQDRPLGGDPLMGSSKATSVADDDRGFFTSR